MREADRLDPDVDHRSTDVPARARRQPDPPRCPTEPEAHTRTQERQSPGRRTRCRPGPETTPPDEAEWDAERARRDQI